MKKMRMTLLGVSAAALLGSIMVPATVDAKTRVHVAVKTPHVKVGVTNTSRHLDNRGGFHPVRTYDVGNRNRAIALRLASYTGVSPKVMLRLKRRGFNWVQIGRRIGISRQVVKAAMYPHTWKRFLRLERQRCGTDFYLKGQVYLDTHDGFEDSGFSDDYFDKKVIKYKTR